MTEVTQTETVLDTIYQRILAELQQTIASQNSLYTALTQLCVKAQQQDQTIALSCLPIWSYLAAGGEQPFSAVPLAAAWRCWHLAGKLLNNVAKQSPNPYLPAATPAELLNASTALLLLGQTVLANAAGCEMTAAQALQFQRDFAQTGLHTAVGQHLQLGQNENISLAAYETIVAQRSGGPFALALRIGAQLGLGEVGVSEQNRVQSLADYGYHLGMMIQLADDFNGVWRPVGRSDLAAGRRTWPLCYAEIFAGTVDYSQLQQLIKVASADPQAEAQARDLMVQLGVPFALAMASEKHRYLAENALASLPESQARYLLTKVVQRVCLVPKTM